MRAPSPEHAAVTDSQHSQADTLAFASLALRPEILSAVAALNYDAMTPVQAKSLPALIEGRDLLAQAKTGSGKTAAFAISLLNRLDESAYHTQALVICPTRELAEQVAEEIRRLARGIPNVKTLTLCGGRPMGPQLASLKRAPHIVVGTPGRLLKHLAKETLRIDRVETLVLDEADRMLDMGFIPDVKRIIRHNKPVGERQTLLFSATFNDDVLNLVNNWTRDAEFIEIEAEQLTTDKVDQTVFMVSADEKLNVICNYIQKNGVERAIIFGNRRDETRRLQETLRRLAIKCALLSGEVPQHKRIKTLEGFKKGDIQIASTPNDAI